MGAVRDYITAVEAVVTAHFSERVATVSHLIEGDAGKIATPAVLIDVEEIDDGIDAGDERQPVTLQVSMYCILSEQTPEFAIEIREFALELMRITKCNRWGLQSIGAPKRLQAAPTAFAPVKRGHIAWSVTFEQSLDIGASVWDPPEGSIVPDHVFVGFAPEIGVPHVDDYVQVYPRDQGQV